jgi:hypothetical protein
LDRPGAGTCGGGRARGFYSRIDAGFSAATSREGAVFTLVYCDARIAFALACLLIGAGALLVLAGLVAGALHRNALHSMAAM